MRLGSATKQGPDEMPVCDGDAEIHKGALVGERTVFEQEAVLRCEVRARRVQPGRPILGAGHGMQQLDVCQIVHSGERVGGQEAGGAHRYELHIG